MDTQSKPESELTKVERDEYALEKDLYVANKGITLGLSN